MDRLRFLERSYTRESPFTYECHACSRCCHGKIIHVNPYEVARLARNRDISTTDFLARYTEAHGTTLKQTEEGACVFLTRQGCGVHRDRPLVCRLYPLGRRVASDGEETFREMSPHPQTEGEYGTSGTVQDYLTKQGAQPFIDAVERYVHLVGRMASKLRASISKYKGLHDEVKVTVDGVMQDDSGQRFDRFDMDLAVARFCSQRRIPVPDDIIEKMCLHVRAVEEWERRSNY
jgi:uncharacterized protein